MFIPNLLKRWTKGPTKPRTSRRVRQSTRLSILQLEERVVPTLFTVSSLADSGLGSLREAIGLANTNFNGADQIDFASGLTGQITLTSGQLEINDDLSIAGQGRPT